MPSENENALPKGKSCFTSVDDVNSNGRTALHIAARYDEHECVQALLTRGANREARDSDGKTPIQLALWKYHLDRYKLGCESIKILVKVEANIGHLTKGSQAIVGRCLDDDSPTIKF